MHPADAEKVYKSFSFDKIPWICEEPPSFLVDMIEKGVIKPCRTIDLGCGTGNYSIYLARLGFDVTGVDSSPTAVKAARKNALKKNVDCKFVNADLCGDAGITEKAFDFALEWLVLHHIFPDDRERYVKNVSKLLNRGAKYLSVSFSENDKAFGGRGKYRRTSVGTTLYFSNERELLDLFLPYFKIVESEEVEIQCKSPHAAIRLLLEKR